MKSHVGSGDLCILIRGESTSGYIMFAASIDELDGDIICLLCTPTDYQALPYGRGRGSGRAALPLPLQKATIFNWYLFA
jgi:hypothetical protein